MGRISEEEKQEETKDVVFGSIILIVLITLLFVGIRSCTAWVFPSEEEKEADRILNIKEMKRRFGTHAAGVRIEDDFDLTGLIDKYPDKQISSAMGEMVARVQLSGYRCDSITAFRPTVWDVGYSLWCNGNRYHYEIIDKGGRWIVHVD